MRLLLTIAILCSITGYSQTDTIYIGQGRKPVPELVNSKGVVLTEVGKDTAWFNGQLFSGIIVHEVDLLGDRVSYAKRGDTMKRTFCSYSNGVPGAATVITYCADYFTPNSSFETRTIALPGTEFPCSVRHLSTLNTSVDHEILAYDEFGRLKRIEKIVYSDRQRFSSAISLDVNGDTVSVWNCSDVSCDVHQYYYTDKNDHSPSVIIYVMNGMETTDIKSDKIIFIDASRHIVEKAVFLELLKTDPNWGIYLLTPQEQQKSNGYEFIIYPISRLEPTLNENVIKALIKQNRKRTR